MKTEIYRARPQGSCAFRPADLPVVIYFGNSSKTGRPYAMAYSGNKNKADFYHNFLTEERREQYVANYLNGMRQTRIRQAAERVAKAQWQHDFQPGDILSGSWGYDQTNVEYYQVTAVRGKSILIRKLAQRSVEGSDGFMSDRRLPVKDEFIGPEVRKIPRNGYRGEGYVTVGCASLSRWDGKPEYCSWYA